jgi:hypothetical protein
LAKNGIWRAHNFACTTGRSFTESFSVKERVENIKDKNGQVTGTRTFYSEEVIYTFAATAAINNYKGIHVMDEVLSNPRL